VVHFEILHTYPHQHFLMVVEVVAEAAVVSVVDPLGVEAVVVQLPLVAVVEVVVEVVVVPLVLDLHLTLLEICSQKFLLLLMKAEEVVWKLLG